MPELPEVEMMRRGLLNTVLNKQVIAIKILKHKIVAGNGTTRIPNPEKSAQMEAGVVGSRITKITRRNKNIIISLFKGDLESGCLLVHLKMTGQFRYYNQGFDEFIPSKHACIVFYLKSGGVGDGVENDGLKESVLVYEDIRQFGYVLFYPSIATLEASPEWKSNSLDGFLDKLELDSLYPIFHKSSKSIKKILLDQSPIGGVGNIYADEICFASSILPMRPSKSLSKKELALILENTTEILADAVDKGGSSISDYTHVDGEKGSFANYHKVYGRAGKACVICEAVLTKTTEAGRTTVFCNQCQH
jgi:formamidopyrimidine-DNA glycosylase